MFHSLRFSALTPALPPGAFRHAIRAGVLLLLSFGIGAAPASAMGLQGIHGHRAEYFQISPVHHDMPRSEHEFGQGASERHPKLRRGTRRILRFFGLASQRELDTLHAEYQRLTEELHQARRALAAGASQTDDATRGQQEIDRKARTIALMRDQLQRVKAEVAFRTRKLRRGAASQQALGFGGLYFSAPDPMPPGPYYEKSYRERFEVSGLEAHRACWLELTCLQRLQNLDADFAAHFPAPVLLDPATPRLTMTDMGWSLDIVPAELRQGIATRVAPRIGEQTARIVAGLEAAGVVHLDAHASGRNLAVDATGHVSLIDFDIAAFDGSPISAAIAQRLDRWRGRGGYRVT